MNKNKNISTVIKQLFKYSILNGLEAIVPFAFLIILTRFISPYDYGIWALFVSLYSFMVPVIGGRFDDAVRMYYNDLSRNDLRRFVISTFIITTIISLVSCVLFYLFREPISTFVKFPENWLFTLILTAYLSAIFEIIRAVFQFKKKVKLIMYMIILKVSSILIVTYILLQNELTYGAAIIGTIFGISFSIFVMLLLYNPMKFFRFNVYFSKRFYKKLLGFFILYLPTGFGVLIIPLTDRLLISHFASIEETGLYSIASLYGAALTTLVTSAFLLAWMPWLFDNLKERTADCIKSIKTISILYYIGLPIAGLVLWQTALLFSHILVKKEFSDSDDYILLLVTAAIVQSYFLHNQTFLHYLKKSRAMSVNMAMVVILNVILSYYGIQHFGVKAVAYSTIISYTIGSLTNAMTAYIIFKKQKLLT